MTFKMNDLVFFNNKNIVINKSFKKLNDKMFNSFKNHIHYRFFLQIKIF